MKYTVEKPDGTEAHFRSRDAFVIAYNNHEIEAGWFAKAEGASEWSRVWELLGVPPPATADTSKPADSAAAGAGSAGVSEAVRTATTQRYLDAYRVAAATVAIGQAVKVLAICLAGIALVVPMVGVSQSIANQLTASATPLLLGLVAAVAVGVPFYALGILVSAIGQVLKATLDTAVHTSPFLDKNQMAQIMARH